MVREISTGYQPRVQKTSKDFTQVTPSATDQSVDHYYQRPNSRKAVKDQLPTLQMNNQTYRQTDSSQRDILVVLTTINAKMICTTTRLIALYENTSDRFEQKPTDNLVSKTTLSTTTKIPWKRSPVYQVSKKTLKTKIMTSTN